MEKLNDLEELRTYLTERIGGGLETIKKRYIYSRINDTTKEAFVGELSGWEQMRAVIVANRDTGIRCCERAEKQDGDVEIMRVNKLAVRQGLKPGLWDEITAKCSKWLEDNGFYDKQKRVPDETLELFEVSKRQKNGVKNDKEF